MTDSPPGARRTRPAQRYGDAPAPLRRVGLLAAVAVLCAAGLTFLGWVALHAGAQPARAAVVAFDSATPTSLRVRVELVKAAEATVTCRVVVRDATATAVGAREVGAGPEQGRRSVRTVVVPASALPVSAEVVGCREQ